MSEKREKTSFLGWKTVFRWWDGRRAAAAGLLIHVLWLPKCACILPSRQKKTEPRRAKNAVTFLFVHRIDPGFFYNVLHMLHYKPAKKNLGYHF